MFKMGVKRHPQSGLSVFDAMKISDGPPEVWVAIGVDHRVTPVAAVLGYGPTMLDAEVDAIVQLGATPTTVRAVLAIPETQIEP